MAWTTPKENWVAGDAVTATLLNNIGANLAALKTPPGTSYVANQGSDYTTSSTSFVDVDATNLALTITTNGGDVMVHVHCNLVSASGVTMLDVAVDGARHAGDDGIIAKQTLTSSPPGIPTTFTRLITGLSAGSHTFKLQWKVTAGSTVMYAGAGTGSSDLHPQMWVREIS